MSTEYNAALRDEMWSSLQKSARDIDPQLVLDIAGIFDPTPISDGASVAVSLWRGQFVDALLGGASMIPYLGDAAAKPFKIARKYGPEAMKVLDGLNTLRKAKTADMMDALRKIEPAAIHRARSRAAEAVKKAQAKKRAGCNTEECRKLRKSNMPSGDKGNWNPPNARDTGDGTYTFKDQNGVERSVEFKDGYPNFDAHTTGGKFQLDNPSPTSNVSKDTEALFREYPDAFPGGQPPNTTLHHFEDGSVGFVNSDFHDNVAHSGFRSVQKTDLF
jgi:hypothetical protein